MDNEQLLDSQFASSELILNSSAKNYLWRTAKWGKFLAVVGIIYSVIIIIAGLFIGIEGLNSQKYGAALSSIYSSRLVVILGGILYAVVGLIFMYPAIRLSQFSRRARTAIELNDTLEMETAFKRLRSVFRFYGIMVIIALSLIALMILVLVAKNF